MARWSLLDSVAEEDPMLPQMIARGELDRLDDPRLFRELAYVNGRWQSGDGGATQTVVDPATGAVIGAVAVLERAEAAAAVEAAHSAFTSWRNLSPAARGNHLETWVESIRDAKEDLATLMTLEQGKPLAEARGEIDYASDFIAYYAEEAKRPHTDSVTSPFSDAETVLRREPVGVAGLVTPWNFPSAMITRKAAAALAAGCSVVVHPSMQTPFSALALAELADRSGLPAGVFNVVPGDPQTIVGELCHNPTVRAMSFTGSTAIGRLIARQCADTMKVLIMELGGHAPFIVFADADLERAVDGAIAAKFATSGQDCLAANRIYVERPVYDAFAKAFTARVESLTVGNGFEEDVDIGPLINEGAVAKSEDHVDDALRRGARLVTGGARHPLGGNFFSPTVLADVPRNTRIMREETFGPVAALTPFDDDAQLLRDANATEYGLVAYLFGKDRKRVAWFCDRLEFGMIAVNRAKITGASIPFGGVKQSGLGREGSRFGLEAFTEPKYLCLDRA
jgi:aspartate-semialdehyde dehydrogenase